MGAPFRDITFYNPTPHKAGTEAYWDQVSLENYICDLYMIKMNGYKPPNTTRITIQPAYHKIWDRTWKNGSLVSIAPYFSYEDFQVLDKMGKYLYLLNIIQEATLQLSEEYNWDKSVFERAYEDVLKCDFLFRKDYPIKTSGDKAKQAQISIVKSETVTTVNAIFTINEQSLTVKLLDKKNGWWYDSAYQFAKHSKWFDNERFGFNYKTANLKAAYSISDGQTIVEKNRVRLNKDTLHQLFYSENSW